MTFVDRALFWAATLLVTLCVNQSNASAADGPNIIYIMADDLGYGDLGCYGSTKNKTPNIDSLARGGVRLTDFHAAPWCAPSRRALMTGCHAWRPWNIGDKKWARLASAITIPEMLKKSGYGTALIGKWHLEMSEGLHPLDQGFDYWYGTRGSNDWNGPRPNYGSFQNAPEEEWKTPLYINRENEGPIVSQSEFTKRYTQETVRLINEYKESGERFFIYLAHNMPHVPIFASEDFQGVSDNGVYGDVVAEIDWSVGQIVAALRGNDMLENTVVVFTSDNGPWTMFKEFGGIATPLRGEKSTTWEGGERVPAIVFWPTKIKPRVCDEFTVNYDIYATVAALAGATVEQGHAIDSIDMSEVLLNDKPSKRTKHLHHFRNPVAWRSGKYKLHWFTRSRTRNPETGAQEPSVRHDPPLLFDLACDVAEQHDIAAKHPDVVARLTQEFEAAQEALENWKPFPN